MRYVRMLPMPSTPLVREIFIMAGESDMSGRGLLSESPYFSTSRVKVFSNDWVWREGAEPVDDPASQIDLVSIDGAVDAPRGTSPGASCGMSFATTISSLRPDVEIAIVPCARGGSKIAEWSRNTSRSTLYGSMLARALTAAQDGTLKGVLWFQGKNDANDVVAASTWDTSCYQLIANIRADLGIPTLPVIVTALGNSAGLSDVDYWNTIRTKQLAMFGSGISVVDTLDLPQKPDDLVHLSTAGLVTLGQRYAVAMNNMLGAVA